MTKPTSDRSSAPPQDILASAEPTPAQGLKPPSIPGMIKRTLAHWRLAMIVAILGVGLTVLFVQSRKPAYRSETVIFYREGVALGREGPDPLRTLSARLKETLLARSNLEKIITEFNLYPEVVDGRGMVDAVERLKSKILFRTRSADTFAISYEGATREEAQAVTERLASSLAAETSRVQESQAKRTATFLAERQKQAEEDVRKAETELAKFLSSHPEFAQESVQPGGSQAGASIRAEQRRVTEGDPTLEALQRQAPRLRSRLTAPTEPIAPTPAPPPPAALVQKKQQAEQALAAARRDLQQKQQHLTEQHPDVRAAVSREAAAAVALQQAEQALTAATQAQVSEAQESPTGEAEHQRIRTELTKIELEIAQRKRAQANQQPSGESEMAQHIIDVETEWSRLTREKARAQQQLGELEAKAFKAEIAASSEQQGYSAQMVVLDPAFKPSVPSTKPRSVIALAGVAASILFGIALAAGRGIFLDDRIYDAEDLDRFGFSPLLAVVPRAGRSRWWRRG